MKKETNIIHGGQSPDPLTGAIMPPIYQTTTYVQPKPQSGQEYQYARSKNPTRDALQRGLAAIEGAHHAFSFSSGMAAIDSVLRLLRPGDEVLATSDLYGGTYRLMSQLIEPMGITCRYIDMSVPEDIIDQITPATQLLWLETPTNPTLNILDIQHICTIARDHGIMICVDNTFASPYLQNPIALGAHIVMHSASKYINGHSDVLHGCVITDEDEIAERLAFIQNAVGAIPSPMDCYLVLRGLKTMHLRVERACHNAHQIADYLQGHRRVGMVRYPGLASHPDHDIATRQMCMYGAVVAFDLADGTVAEAHSILSSTRLFALSESLGGVESQIGHPATMSHVSVPRSRRLDMGISDSMVRLSIGIEHVDDLISDLDRTLSSI